MVCSVDQLASSTGLAMLRRGGSAVDAAVATNAVLAVTAPHMCGMGGDLFALVHVPGRPLAALNASGPAGSGADPDALRAAGHTTMPLRGDVASVTVPGCVDGWLALHARYGRLPLEEVLAPAAGYAEDGFGASPLLAQSSVALEGVVGAEDLVAARHQGARVRRPGVARALRAVASDGRSGFYGGDFGRGLSRIAPGLFTPEDLARDNAEWTTPLSVRVFGHDVWTAPPNSQGYLLLLSMAIAERLELPDDPADPAWAHLLIEASRQAGYDRPDRLFDGADVSGLLTEGEVGARAARVDPGRAGTVSAPADPGDTTYLCAVDGSGMGVSLIQSNAAGFGSGIFEPSTGIGLHNRGLGFHLSPGHPAEYRPGMRPPHTLVPAVVTRPDGTLRAVAGTMGGDTQPQILLQVLTRLLRHGQTPGEAIGAPRFRLGNLNGFDTWTMPTANPTCLETGAPQAWDGLADLGHRLERTGSQFGHAHLIEVSDDEMRGGAADPRAVIGAVAAD
ncbi:gamma-glutamyltransferase family protein [Stackebrandtia albiflava]